MKRRALLVGAVLGTPLARGSAIDRLPWLPEAKMDIELAAQKSLKFLFVLWCLACSSLATAMYVDGESGLDYNYHRSYRPSDGRYTQPDPSGLAGGWDRFGYVDGNPLTYTDPFGLSKVHQSDGVTFHSYPGPQAGGREHARQGPGESYHLHLRDRDGREARLSSETWKPLTPEDKRIFDSSKDMRRACDNLTDGEKKFIGRVNREVFHRGAPTERQLMRLLQMRPNGGGNGIRGTE
jgi:RHS repeat-associated protein